MAGAGESQLKATPIRGAGSDLDEVLNSALGYFDSEIVLKDLRDLAVWIALAAKLPDEVEVGLQARAHGVVGDIVEKVLYLLIHVSFVTN